MISRLAILLVLILAAPAAAAAAGAPARSLERAVQLRDVTTVQGDVVRLGDLFANVGDKATQPVAYAPDPGRRAVFDALWLYRLARAHRLDWRPASRHVQAVVVRDSIVVGNDEIEGYVVAALNENGVDTESMRVELSNRRLRLHLPASATSDVGVEDVAYDTRRGHFAAVLVASADGAADRRVRVTGRLQAITEVPVTTRRIRAGDVIAAADIDWSETPTRSLPHDTVLEAEQLIGKTPRRGLRPGVPVRASEIQDPIVVARGDTVTIVLATRKMLLTSRGRALEDGSRHQVIRVSNAKSGGIVEARVSGPGQVTVGLPGGPDRR